MTWFLALAQGHKVQKLNLAVETSGVEISCNLNFKVYFNVYFAWLFLFLSQKVEYVVVGSLARFEAKLSSTASLKWTEVGFIYTFSKILSISFTILSRNPSIYNILSWVAWTMGQTNRPPRVWCCKYYFLYTFYRLKTLKTLHF